MTIRVDTSELRALERDLAAAGAAIYPKVSAALTVETEIAASSARATAASYPQSTGRLAGSVTTSTSGLERRIDADAREGFFLEYGSPNTGAPRPWLSGPAAKAQSALLAELGRIARPV